MRTSTASLLAVGLCGGLAVHLVAAPAAADDGKEDLRQDQPGLEAVGAPDSWERNRGSGATVAVLDTGVDGSHPDLKDQVTSSDDVTGQDLEPGDDGYGEHGTGLAGIIAASGHGREHTGGVMGVAPEAEILSVRVAADEDLGAGDSIADDALQRGIDHAVEEGAVVITLPADAGSGDGEREAVERAVRSGVLVVAPGESALAGHENVLGVGAVDDDLRPTGDNGDGVALRAPGNDVPTLAPDNAYARLNGGAPAAAFVAGAAALIRAENPQLLPGQVTDALVNSAQPAADSGDTGVLHVPDATAAAAETAEDIPLYDESLVQEDDEPLVPMWAWWAGGALLLVLLVLFAFRLVRARRDPYGIRSAEAGTENTAAGTAPENTDTGRAGRRKRGRRRSRRAARE
ncbi:subtilisin family serine protease [Lipingzhangella halophila]|uniref:Subtilisin family serine protease n=1 Tax=Lipingzhangella halophila TaxID=1783352 RepID=A0A7W7W4S2_9ACTN|nr:S8 family serine peptidase [Lipingzhangella halophila]MBB4934111.1 subtilisin family serine protease [Lipingzhangella halophila]